MLTSSSIKIGSVLPNVDKINEASLLLSIGAAAVSYLIGSSISLTFIAAL
jgi:hypothetical protein